MFYAFSKAFCKFSGKILPVNCFEEVGVIKVIQTMGVCAKYGNMTMYGVRVNLIIFGKLVYQNLIVINLEYDISINRYS